MWIYYRYCEYLCQGLLGGLNNTQESETHFTVFLASQPFHPNHFRFPVLCPPVCDKEKKIEIIANALGSVGALLCPRLSPCHSFPTTHLLSVSSILVALVFRLT